MRTCHDRRIPVAGASKADIELRSGQSISHRVSDLALTFVPV